MVELPLVFLGGVLGSAHCVGMCGGFALSIGAHAGGLRQNVVRQMVYSAGRISTYATGGALVGYAGLQLVRDGSPWVNVQAVLALVAGALLVFQGLSAAGLMPRRAANSAAGCLAGTLVGQFLRGPALHHAFFAGILTGLLPCGLVYAFLALAASTTHALMGLVVMVLFGLGTVPVMLLTGCGASVLSLAARAHLFRVAGVAVAITGAISIARGMGFLHVHGWIAWSGCPGCP